MKKSKVVGGIVVLVLLVVIVAWIMIDSLAKRAVQDGGQYALGVPTTVETVNLSLLGGSLKMDTLNVSNPTGYNTAHLMRTGHFNLAVNPGSVFSETVVVPTFELDGLDVNIEAKGLASNIGVVLDHVKKLGGSSEGQPKAQEQSADRSEGKKVRIDRVVIRNVVAHVTPPLPGAQPITVKVPTIELNNVSSDQGISVEDLIGRLVPAIVASILEAGKGVIPADLQGMLNTQLASTVSALGGQATQLVQQSIGQVSAQVQQVMQQVQQAVPEQAGQIVGDAARQAQGAMEAARQGAVGQLQQAVGGIAATQPAGAAGEKDSKDKNDLGGALKGLLKK